MQREHGRDKLAVVLLSVDPGYFEGSDAYLKQARTILQSRRLDWPSAFLPGGWSDAERLFNMTGYGNILVDPQGIVRGVNVHQQQLEALVRRVLEEKSPDKSAR